MGVLQIFLHYYHYLILNQIFTTVLVNAPHSKNGQVVLTRKESEFESENVLYFTAEPLPTTGLSLLLSGKGVKNPGLFVAIRKVNIFRSMPEGHIFYQPSNSILDLTTWLERLSLLQDHNGASEKGKLENIMIKKI